MGRASSLHSPTSIILRANRDGTMVEDFVRWTDNWYPRGLALDASGGYLYFTNSGHVGTAIVRQSILGDTFRPWGPNKHEDLVHIFEVDTATTSYHPWAIALDMHDGKLYW